MEKNILTQLSDTAQQMVVEGKGILAMDESHPTCRKRFDAHRLRCTVTTRGAYRSMLVTAKNFNQHISAVILFDETIRQTVSGTKRTFARYLKRQGVIPGIKVDGGAKLLANAPDEKITEGLDGLRERLAEYRKLGAQFAKWRAVINIDNRLPTYACMIANAHALARYAALCQEAGVVPIVEPEVLMDGNHTIKRCAEVTREMQLLTFEALDQQNVAFGGMVLKPNMVVSGLKSRRQAGPKEVAEHTLACLLDTVPASVPGIAFLSGGMSSETASANLNAINLLAWRSGYAPWNLTFSYGRALQQDALTQWASGRNTAPAAQAAFIRRARLNGMASLGEYDATLENAD